MAHFARLDSSNTVIRVHNVDNNWILDENGIESEQIGIKYLQDLYKTNDKFVQTSIHSNFRLSYATKGMIYNEEHDVFIKQKPYPSWILNPVGYGWEPPIPMPDDGKNYSWNEQSKSWEEIIQIEN